MDGAKRVAWTIGMVGLWAFLGAMAMYGWDPFNMDSEAWRAVCVAIISGVGMFVTNAIAPWIKQYGFGAKT